MTNGISFSDTRIVVVRILIGEGIQYSGSTEITRGYFRLTFVRLALNESR